MKPEIIYFSELDENFPDPAPNALDHMIATHDVFWGTYYNREKILKEFKPDEINKHRLLENACYF